jgi:predicted PurR-regulated permease PerM
MEKTFNKKLIQVIVLVLTICLGILLFKQLYVFLPGILGGLTLFILSRGLFFKLVYDRKWKKGPTALLFVFAFIIIFAIPIYFSAALITPKINQVVANQNNIVATMQTVAAKLSEKFDTEILSPENIKTAVQKITGIVPNILSGTATSFANLLMMFFLLYFMLMGGNRLEKQLHKTIPLKPGNTQKLVSETKMMIRANALGIPIICIVQGVFAAIGYAIFKVPDWALWGFLTGIFAFFPFVGTMIIWVPLCILLYTQGAVGGAIGLGLYSLLVTGNVDYVARITFMKKMGDVHPLITVFGVIVGLNLFGFVGLIFGPLLVSYFLILVKIYINEFVTDDELN